MKRLFLTPALACVLTLSVCAQGNGAKPAEHGGAMTITIKGGKTFTATLVQNSSAAALLDMLKTGPITIQKKNTGKLGDNTAKGGTGGQGA
jgi:hypothetical protein